MLMQPHNLKMAAGEFKAKCLRLMDQVNETHVAITITKHGVPIAKLVPVDDKPMSLFGIQHGALAIKGDIISPVDESWDANQ
jgi:prevent-host-death family protein